MPDVNPPQNIDRPSKEGDIAVPRLRHTSVIRPVMLLHAVHARVVSPMPWTQSGKEKSVQPYKTSRRASWSSSHAPEESRPVRTTVKYIESGGVRVCLESNTEFALRGSSVRSRSVPPIQSLPASWRPECSPSCADTSGFVTLRSTSLVWGS